MSMDGYPLVHLDNWCWCDAPRIPPFYNWEFGSIMICHCTPPRGARDEKSGILDRDLGARLVVTWNMPLIPISRLEVGQCGMSKKCAGWNLIWIVSVTDLLAHIVTPTTDWTNVWRGYFDVHLPMLMIFFLVCGLRDYELGLARRARNPLPRGQATRINVFHTTIMGCSERP